MSTTPETKPALNLQCVPLERTFSIDDTEDFPPVRLLGHKGECRTGVIISRDYEDFIVTIYDEHTRQVFRAFPNEYEPNVHKDIHGNPRSET